MSYATQIDVGRWYYVRMDNKAKNDKLITELSRAVPIDCTSIYGLSLLHLYVAEVHFGTDSDEFLDRLEFSNRLWDSTISHLKI